MKRKAKQKLTKTQTKLRAAEATLAHTPLLTRERSFEPILKSHWNPAPRLHVGDVIELRSEGGDFAVVMVNDCRAYCIPLRTRDVTFKTVFGKQISFNTKDKGVSISPNSDTEIKQRLGIEGLKKHFSGAITRPETEERNAVSIETAEETQKPPTAQAERKKSASSKQSESKKGSSSEKSSDKKKGSDSDKKGSSAKSAGTPAEVSYKGRSERIKALVKAGKHKDFDAIYEVVNKEYPQSSPSKVRKVYQAALAELKEKK